MDPVIQRYLCDLMLYAEAAEERGNRKEVELIGKLDGLLTQADEGRSLDEEWMASAQHKTSVVPCFAERYYPIVQFLEKYSAD